MQACRQGVGAAGMQTASRGVLGQDEGASHQPCAPRGKGEEDPQQQGNLGGKSRRAAGFPACTGQVVGKRTSSPHVPLAIPGGRQWRAGHTAEVGCGKGIEDKTRDSGVVGREKTTTRKSKGWRERKEGVTHENRAVGKRIVPVDMTGGWLEGKSG